VPHAKFTSRREGRFLTLVEAGATVAEAARAVQLSRMTIHRHRRADTLFAHRLDLARIRPAGPPVELPDDWRDAAHMLEQISPERWAPPDFDFDPQA
jgi:hypothetical protein